MPWSSADPNAFVALGMQSGLGSPQTTASKLRYAKYLSGTDFQPMLDVVDLREGGDGLDYGYSYKRQQKVTGQLVVNARSEIAGQILQAIPGGATWDGASGPAVHTFHTGHASFPWMTLAIQAGGSTVPALLSDVRFTGITIEGQSGQPIKLTVPFTAITHVGSFTALVPTYIAEEPFLFQGNPTYVLDGSADSDITSFRITHTFGVEELQSQAVTLDEIVVQNRDTDIEIVRRYEDPTLWRKINLGAGYTPTTSVATGAFRAAQAIGAGAALKQLDINARLISYRGNSLSELDPDGKTIMETISGRVLKGATHALFVQLTNAHPSAYAS